MVRTSRLTKQKQLLIAQSQKLSSFFNAEQLYAIVSEKDSRIGIATVYRFLREQSVSGNLFSYQCDGKTIYSSTKKSHCHFRCQSCGTTTHFDVSSIDFLQKKVPGTVGSFTIDVEGICKNCLKQK